MVYFPLQILATGAQSLLLLALGMMLAMPTVVIAALLYAKNGLSITDTQASWFGNLLILIFVFTFV